MLQPNPGGVHDDHIHVRTTCAPEERVTGCEPIGTRRPWLTYELPALQETDRDLALALLQPFETPAAPAPSAQTGARAKSTP